MRRVQSHSKVILDKKAYINLCNITIHSYKYVELFIIKLYNIANRFGTTWALLKGKVIIMSVNNLYEYKIEIDTMEDARRLVAIATGLEGKILLRSGSRFCINAKSLLGVILAKKLNWSDLVIIMDNDYYTEFEKYIAA